jgi:hypothetical protein
VVCSLEVAVSEKIIVSEGLDMEKSLMGILKRAEKKLKARTPTVGAIAAASLAPAQDAKNQLLLQRVIQRARLIEEIFDTVQSLQSYTNAHPSHDVILKRVTAAVRGKHRRLQALGRSVTERRSSDRDVYGAYRALVQAHVVDPAQDYSEIPSALNLCQLLELLQWYRQILSGVKKPTSDQSAMLRLLEDALQAKLEFLYGRWEAITGTQLILTMPPLLSELDHHKAPAPLYPAWSNELYSLEARRMKHTPALPEAVAAAAATATTEGTAPTRKRGQGEATASRTQPASESSSASETAAESAGATADFSACDLTQLYELSGGKVPKQPGDEDKHYTFPGTLNRHENIFYDYSLILPADECMLPGSDGGMQVLARDLGAAKLLASKATAISQYLKDTGLGRALGDGQPGTRLLDRLDAALTRVLGLPPGASAGEMRECRRQVGELAGLMRLSARAEALLQGLPGNPSQTKADLRNALDAMPFFEQVRRNLPTATSEYDEDNPAPAYSQPTLGFRSGPSPLSHVPTGYSADRMNKRATTGMYVPHADRFEDWEVDFPNALDYENHTVEDYEYGYAWSVRGAQRYDLRNYIRYLGQDFYPVLRQLVDKAEAMWSAVEALRYAAPNLDNDIRRLSLGVINEAASALSIILSEMADALALPRRVPIEGGKRLGVQLVFRQYWHPVAHVMGKLVGYKNLLPNQRDTLKRRTFVKTTRELVKAEDFATTRQDDYSRSQRETGEVVKEASRAFNFTENLSGSFNFGIGSVQTQTQIGLDLRQSSKTTQSMVSEVAMKGSTSYAEKREVKLREMVETEDVQEVSSEVANLNREITANYFYYQLLREYRVAVALHDIRPVLLRKRALPSAAEIDEKFISLHAHALIPRLPAQLSSDAQETADRLDGLTRARTRRRTEMHEAWAELASARAALEAVGPAAGNEAAYNRALSDLQSKERALASAREASQAADDAYFDARARMDRVVHHVRENVAYYMQCVWQSSLTVDQDMVLSEESFAGALLPAVTRGLSRLGYSGDEEIFEYTGPAVGLLDAMLSHLTPGAEIVDSMSEEELRNTEIYQYLARYCPDDARTLKDRIRALAFVTDPANPEDVIRTRSVQIPQDALVVETMPGAVPLLEGFQMAHRMLDTQRACLENIHLKQRIVDRPWKEDGSDTYAVRRYEGEVPPVKEVVEQTPPKA